MVFGSYLGGLIGCWLYYASMESSSKQATYGKMALGIIVTDLYGNRIGFGKATGRYFGKFVSGLILCIGYIMVAFTQKKQGLHDIMSGCLVVNRRPDISMNNDASAEKTSPSVTTVTKRDKTEPRGQDILEERNYSDSHIALTTEAKSMKPSLSSEEDFYEKALNEFESEAKIKGLWAKSFADAQGNEPLAKAIYLKVRAGQLSNEYAQYVTKERERGIELIRQQKLLTMSEQQRQEIEQIAALEANRKETGRDGKFIAYDNGTVLDTRTNLMWAATDNGSGIKWHDAKSYCERCSGGGYKDWRMPTMDELKTLFDKNKKYKIGWMTKVHLTNLITLSDVWLWSWASESGGLEFADFNFDEGTKYWYSRSPEDELLTLPVRSVK